MIGRSTLSPRLAGRGLLFLLSASLGACAFIPEEDVDWRLDPDGDGLQGEEDCDPADADVGGPTVFYTDADGDGYGDSESTQEACTQPEGTSRLDGDCDDSEASAHPGGEEVWYDGVDQDCDGNDDDQDLDGFVAEEAGGDDCDDTDDEIYPSDEGRELWYDGIDQNCDGADDYDQDGDGWDVTTDCDDTDPDRYPDSDATPEVYYNGVDDNCDLTDGDGDADGDGFWHDNYEIVVLENGFGPMEIPAGAEGDCWDAEDDSERPSEMSPINGAAELQPGEVYPGAPDDFYDAVDADCAGIDADGDGAEDDFDADNDTYVSSTVANRDGETGDDCDDADATINPGELETWYDGLDADCAGDDDYDADQDGYTSDGYGGTDCDDSSQDVNPAAVEICNDFVDDNCDGDDNGCSPGGDLDVSSAATATILGDSTYDYLGYTMGSGDLDGDGTTDLVGGAYLAYDSTEGYIGRLYAVLGPVTADGRSSGSDVVVTGSSSIAYLGYGDAVLQDIDGDGYEDLLGGAYASQSGVVVLFYGPVTGALNADEADLIVAGTSNEAAYDVVGGGDIDGDGKRDLLIGANSNDDLYTDGGAVYALSDITAWSGSYETSDSSFALYGPTSYVQLGTDLAPIADLDGDGLDDMIMGSTPQGYGGGVYIALGPQTASEFVDSVALQLKSPDGEDGAGSALSEPADLNDDGYLDLVVGAQLWDSGTASNTGRALVLHGPFSSTLSLESAAAVFEGSDSSDYAGSKVAVAGDLDADGNPDLAIGAQSAELNNSAEGLVYLLYGPHSGTSALSASDARVYGAAGNDNLGQGLAAAGDQEGDGFDDLFIGAPGVDDGATSGGAIYLLSGGGY